jgi:hypothetical protein
MKKSILLIVAIVSLSFTGFGQSDSITSGNTIDSTTVAIEEEPVISPAMAEMQRLGKLILSSDPDSIRVNANVSFYYALQEHLNDENNLLSDLSQIKNLSVLIPQDSSFRIITWNLPLRNNEILFYGFIQRKGKFGYKVTSLQDHSRDIVTPKFEELSPEKWFGCLYYDIIQSEARGRTYYTLLGWDGNNNRTTRKIIEALWFDNYDRAHFGAPIFPGFELQPVQRVVFEYSKMASMTVRYDEQYIASLRRKQFILPGDPLYDTILIKKNMIIFNRLMPLDEELVGQYEYYLPLGELMDGLLFENGVWNIQTEIDARYGKFDTIVVEKPIELDLAPNLDSIKRTLNSKFK